MLKRLKKDAVVTLLILGILLLSVFFYSRTSNLRERKEYQKLSEKGLGTDKAQVVVPCKED